MRKLTMPELNRLPVADFKATPKSPVVLVLDNVRSLHNVGAVFRTADAFALERIYLCGVTGQPPHREITKTALGSTESVAWTHTATTLEAARQLVAAGYQLVAVEQTTGSVLLPAFRPAPDRPLERAAGARCGARCVVRSIDEVGTPLNRGVVRPPRHDRNCRRRVFRRPFDYSV